MLATDGLPKRTPQLALSWKSLPDGRESVSRLYLDPILLCFSGMIGLLEPRLAPVFSSDQTALWRAEAWPGPRYCGGHCCLEADKEHSKNVQTDRRLRKEKEQVLLQQHQEDQLLKTSSGEFYLSFRLHNCRPERRKSIPLETSSNIDRSGIAGGLFHFFYRWNLSSIPGLEVLWKIHLWPRQTDTCMHLIACMHTQQKIPAGPLNQVLIPVGKSFK